MLLLNSIASTLAVQVSAAGSVHVQSSWIDLLGTTATPGGLNVPAVAAAATVTAVPAPAASTSRNIKDLSIRNTSATVAQVITISHSDGTTVLEKYKCALAAGESVTYDQSGDFLVYDVNGVLKSAAQAPGALVKRTVLTGGTTVTLAASTRAVQVFLQAGGGGGGGATSAAASAACAGGGAQGAASERYVAGVSGGTVLIYAIGTGGAGGTVAGAAGTTGGNTTITLNAVLTTAPGGFGGSGALASASASAALGGVSPGASVNADFVGYYGEPGHPGFQFTGLIGCAGKGSGRGAGGGRNTAGAGNAAANNSGGGGGGACVLNGSAAAVGGSGGAGFIILEEYS